MEARKKVKVVNGVNVDQLFSTIDLIKQNPEVAKAHQSRGCALFRTF